MFITGNSSGSKQPFFMEETIYLDKDYTKAFFLVWNMKWLGIFVVAEKKINQTKPRQNMVG